MAAMFLPLFSVLFCMEVMMKQICWHSRRSEAHRDLPTDPMYEVVTTYDRY